MSEADLLGPAYPISVAPRQRRRRRDKVRRHGEDILSVVPPVPFSSDIGRTPLVALDISVLGRERRVLLKLEGRNPGGSIKARTAYSLVRSVEVTGRLRPGGTIVESTSGNLGLAMASLARERGYGFIAVVDPNASPLAVATLQQLGARVEHVSERDDAGGYLLTRLSRVGKLLERRPELVWTDQYRNPANPRVHFEQTGPEILRATGGSLSAVFVAASTGGTLAGIGRYLKAVAPEVTVVGVDVPGSRVFQPVATTRLLNGIGSGQQSHFLRPSHYDGFRLVDEHRAIATCHALSVQVGMSLGGSSGAVLTACLDHLARTGETGPVVCLCPDDGTNYQETIYSADWLERHHVVPGPFDHRVRLARPDMNGPNNDR